MGSGRKGGEERRRGGRGECELNGEMKKNCEVSRIIGKKNRYE